MVPETNNTGSGSGNPKKEATLKVPSKHSKKKDDKKDEDLPEEDVALKQQLELSVEREDAAQGLQKLALECMRFSMVDLEQHQSNEQSDDENPMPSFRSDLPSRFHSVNAQHPDDLLILKSEFLQLKPNNHHVDFDALKTEHPVIVEILKGHPLSYALTATATVPLIYLQQFWNTITYIPEENNYRFEAFVDHYLTKLTKKRLRLVLQLPQKTEFQGKQDYDDFASEQELCADIRSLGYTEPLPIASSFKRMYLPPIWNTLFSILNRCLTPKHTGIDRCNINVLRLFHGVAFNKHYDYSTIFWTELEELVSDKGNSKARKFLPYQRFLQLIIKSMMRTNKDIPSRSSAPVCPEHEMKYLRKQDEGNFQVVLPLPDDLLAYADQNAQSVREYRAFKSSMVQPEPEGPIQKAIYRRYERRERSRDRSEQGQDTGVHDQGVQRENENERGIERGGAFLSIAQEEPTQIEQDIPEVSTFVDESNESDSLADDDNADSDDNDDDDLNMQMSDFRIENVINQTIGVEGVSEGVLVENVERLSTGMTKEHGESVKGSEKQSDPPQTESVSQVATSTIRSHVMGSGIETIIMEPMMHAQSTPPSHSVISQQMSVSSCHGDLTHILSGSHSENLDIETFLHLLRSPTSFAAHVSLEPYTLLGTHTLSTTTRLSDAAETSRVEPSTGILRGQGGNSTRDNVMPALNVGHTVYSTAVTTGNLSDPGDIFPEFVSREYLDSALKAVQDSFAAQFDSLKRIYKGKEIASADPPPPPPQPQAKTSEDLSVDELKSLLYAKLLSQASEIDPTNSYLLGVLRRSVETKTVTNSLKQEFVSGINTLSTTIRSSYESIDQRLQKLDERLQALEETCKEQAKANSPKRRHDDQDDPDQHEGQKKRQKTTEGAGAVGNLMSKVSKMMYK